LNGSPIATRPSATLDVSLIGIGADEDGRFPGIAAACRGWRRLGSAALNLAYVACGRLDAYVNTGTLAPWDHAAGVPMILAAGGAVSMPDGGDWDYPLYPPERWAGVVASGSLVHPAIIDALH
jgi:myo-inositol-1(or 4)-monophosphatase